MSSNMTFAAGRWPTKEAAVADIQKMLGLDWIKSILAVKYNKSNKG
jgi:hypothetical protein